MYQTYLKTCTQRTRRHGSISATHGSSRRTARPQSRRSTTVLRLQPTNVAAEQDLVVCGDLGDAYAAALHEQNSGNFAVALAFAQKIATAHPTYSNILFVEAWAQWNVGQHEQAIATYRAYLKLHPSNAQAQLNLGVALITLGRCGQAIPPLRTVLKLRSEERRGHPQTWHLRGEANLAACNRRAHDCAQTCQGRQTPSPTHR